MKTTDAQIYVEKGWGYEKWITNTDKYCGKELFIRQGKSLSWHYHIVKDEVFYIASGIILLAYGEDDDRDISMKMYLRQGDSFHVPPGIRHQLTGVEDSRVIEFSTFHSEADSIRVIRGD